MYGVTSGLRGLEFNHTVSLFDVSAENTKGDGNFHGEAFYC